MTDLILPFIPFVAAIAFFIRARGEQKARRAAERSIGEWQQRLERAEAYREQWLATLAHELRTPLAAVVGYGELVEDGTLGHVDTRAADAVTRIRMIADQMLHVVDGLDRALGRRTDDDSTRTLDAAQLIARAVDALRFDAESRQVQLVAHDADVTVHTRPDDAGRVLELVLGAAIKSGPGFPLHIAAEPGQTPALTVSGTRLDPRRDDPSWAIENIPAAEAPHVTGAALRLGMARRITETSLKGALRLSASADGCTVRIELPRLD